MCKFKIPKINMKKLQIILLLIFFNINAQNENQKMKDLITKNNINEIQTYEYNEKGDSIQTGRDIYGQNGNHIEDLRLAGGKVVFKFLIEYNENNLMTKQTGYKENGDISSILLYEYDDNGNQISYKQVKENGEILGHQNRKYNTQNENTELYNLDKEKNEFYLSYKFFYNNDGAYQSTENYNSKGKLISISNYEYKDGNLIKLTSENDGEKYKNSFEYDVNGRLKERKYHRKRDVTINGNKIILKQWEERFGYDDENNLISKITSGNGLDFKIEKYFYIKHTK